MATAPPHRDSEPTHTVPTEARSAGATSPPGPEAGVQHDQASAWPIRRFVYHDIVPGYVTCQVFTEPLVGSAGVALRGDATATAPTADLARDEATGRALAQLAAGFWSPDRLVKHPPSPPHGSGPGPWVRMQVADTVREAWMSAARVYQPFRVSASRALAHVQGMASARDLDQARRAAMRQQITLRAVAPLWQALNRHKAPTPPSAPAAEGAQDVVICHTYGLSLAVSYRWSLAGPLYGLLGVGCGESDEEALTLARHDCAHTEAMLRLQRAGDLGGAPEDGPSGMDSRVYQLACQPEMASNMAVLVCRWRARARSSAAASQRVSLAWADISPPEFAQLGWRAVRALWLDGDAAGFSQPVRL